MPPHSESAARFAAGKLADSCDDLKKQLLGLLDSSGRVAEEVHSIRKLGKSLRGGFSLFGLKQSSGAEIQAIGRLLSEPRDATSRLKTWNTLAWNGDPPVAAAIAALINQQTRSTSRRPPPETIDWCLHRVDAAFHALDEIPTEKLDSKIKKGLKPIVRRAKRHCHTLRKVSSPDLHETRKALKTLMGAADFLPEGAIPHMREVEKLTEHLGDENDLAMLSIWLKNHGFTKKFTPHLWKAIKAARKRIQRKAVKDARHLHSLWKS